MKDYAEISPDIGFGERVDFEQEIEEQIGELAQIGIALFGIRRKFNSKRLGIFETATIVAVKDDSPSIVNDTMIAMLHKAAFGG